MVKKAILTDFDIKKLKPYANNYLKHDKNIEHVANSIRDFGYNKVSIGIDEQGYLIYGHGSLQALTKLKYTVVPYVMQITGLTENQKKAYRIADNESARHAEIDFELLNMEFESFEDEFDLEDYGFESPEVEGLEAEEEIEDIEEVESFNDSFNFIITCKDLCELADLQFKFNTESKKIDYLKIKDKICK